MYRIRVLTKMSQFKLCRGIDTNGIDFALINRLNVHLEHSNDKCLSDNYAIYIVNVIKRWTRQLVAG